nr:hypothetical protein [Pseudomonas aeruginosa]QCO95687.1 Hypothetical protein [Pseudomonas aeruginosa]
MPTIPQNPSRQARTLPKVEQAAYPLTPAWQVERMADTAGYHQRISPVMFVATKQPFSSNNPQACARTA